MSKIIPFEDLANQDLYVDAIYEGGNVTGLASDPLSKILPGIGNQGGFRASGKGENKKFVVLYSSGEDKDWPDSLNPSTGQFIYFGDNKSPGHELHDTQRGGNLILRNVFEDLHTSKRETIPPFFIFQKYPTARSNRSVQFKGVAVPGFPGISFTDDLVAIWKATNQQRFQNYRAMFTVLDVPKISREWIDNLNNGIPLLGAPSTWLKWVQKGSYTPLAAEPTTIIRSDKDQIPDTEAKREILRTVWEHFKDSPIAFESFAARIFQMHDQRVIIDEVTRASVDGGRDAFGRYLLGLNEDPVYAEFSLEAKCYRPPLNGSVPNTVGVKEVSRLISRIKHRQFGVLVTTSLIARQAYEEVRIDKHPVIFFCGRDIAEILIKNGYSEPSQVSQMLHAEFALG